jgi:hypothetical protein
MIRFLHYLLAILLTALVITILAVPITTFSNMIWLNSIGMPVSLSIILNTLVSDWLGLGIPLLIVFFIGLNIAMPVALITKRFIKFDHKIWFSIASSVAVAVALVLMIELLFKTHVIGGTRSLLGQVLHVAAGYLGGIFFCRFFKPKID